MASIGHVAVGLACARAYCRDPAVAASGVSARNISIAFALISLLPDLDAIGFLFGIHYGDSLGHRGATHSLAVAAFIGLASYVFAQRRKLPPLRTAAFVTLTALSHPILDTMTYGGGLGCALLWPFSDERFWAPLRFIPVAPIGLRLISLRGIQVMLAEVVIFAPFWIFAFWPRRSKKEA